MTTDDDFAQFEDEAPAPAKKAAAKKAPAKKRAARPRRVTPPKTEPKPTAATQTGTAARRAEAADDDTVSVEQSGVVITVPSSQGEWPLRAVDAFAAGRVLEGVKYLVGPEKWAEFLDAGTTVNDGNELADKLSEALGLGSAGN